MNSGAASLSIADASNSVLLQDYLPVTEGLMQKAGRCNRRQEYRDIVQRDFLQLANDYNCGMSKVPNTSGFPDLINNVAQIKTELLYEELHQRLLPSVKASLEYLTGYVAFLLGSISEGEFIEIAERTALECDNVITDDAIVQMRALLEKHMGKLDDSDFAVLINVEVARILRKNRNG